MKKSEEILAGRGVKATPNRILVLDTLLAADHPLSLLEIDMIVGTVDKSSIFRVLTMFHNLGLVHAIEDGSNSLKYEVCHGDGHCSPSDMHVHFYCLRCHSTFCFPHTRIPEVEMPEGFQATSVNYMIKGVCPRCGEY